MVVVGSRCHVRKRVLGWKAASSAGFGGSGALSCPRRWAPVRPASDEPRNARRENEVTVEFLPGRDGGGAGVGGSTLFNGGGVDRESGRLDRIPPGRAGRRTPPGLP